MATNMIGLEDDSSMANGQEVVYDCQETSYSYMTQITPSVLKIGITLIYKTWLLPDLWAYILQMFLRIFLLYLMVLHKSLLPGKLRDRVCLLTGAVYVNDL